MACANDKTTTSPRKSLGRAMRVTAALLSCQCMMTSMPTPACEAPAASTKGAHEIAIPSNFNEYGSNATAGGTCVVGDLTDEGMNGRAIVYFKDPGASRPRWATSIPLHEDWYQNRATHCFAMGDALYVLVQSDTSQARSISQTLLDVVEISPETGEVLSRQDADVPGVDAAYSSWVDEGKEGFHADNGKIRISGQYFLTSDPGNRLPFTTTVSPRPPK